MLLRLLFLTLILSVSGILSCQQIGSKYALYGEMSGAENLTLVVEQILPDGAAQPFIKEQLDADGRFRYTADEPFVLGIYRMRIGDKSIFFALDGSETQLQFKGALATLNQWQVEVSGSALAEEYIYTLRDLMAHTAGELEDTRKAVSGVQNPLVAMHMAQMIYRNDPTFLDLHRSIYTKLLATYPTSEYTRRYEVYVANVEKTEARVQLSGPVKVGDMAPEIALPDPNGKVYKLSDLKGKVVLLDFWASWCGPCRVENPNVVAVYNKYKDQGFTVFSVSLDGLDERTRTQLGGDPKVIADRLERTRQQWIQAIEKDQLKWEYHVSDLRKWEVEAAAVYGVTSIPKTFLIDREGKIVRIETRGILEQEVLKHL